MQRYIAVLAGLALLLAACGQSAANDTTDAVTENRPQSVPTAPPPSGKSLQPQLANVDIPLDEIIALLPPDAIPAVLPLEADDMMIPGADAVIDPDARVIGVSVNGDNRAYPVPFLSRHEIVNTTIGGQALAVTW